MSNKGSTSSETEETSEYSVTDILQAHDILISILIGKMIGITKNPQQMLSFVRDMVDMQDVDDKVKNYINLLISPVEDALIEETEQ
ncbi:MAG: hypothetical protein HOM96_04930 [Rickettsiales bacterium]|mgnify:CR=1 FL=1|jgi:hypothetical protein|nr:hypothetical protein [Rickettsiales bacterium]